MKDLSPEAEAAVRRCVHLIASNVGDQAMRRAEVDRVLREIFGNDVERIRPQQLSAIADLLAVCSAVGAAYATNLAGDESGLSDAAHSIGLALRDSFGDVWEI